MNKKSHGEELQEHINALEAKLEEEVKENIKHLGDLRYYEEVQIPELQQQLAEARAEIERLKTEIRDNNHLAARQIVPAEMAVDDLCAEIERKDALIEQMRIALERTMILLDAVPSYAHRAKDEKLRQIGKMVNVDGIYALVRDAMAAEKEYNK